MDTSLVLFCAIVAGSVLAEIVRNALFGRDNTPLVKAIEALAETNRNVVNMKVGTSDPIAARMYAGHYAIPSYASQLVANQAASQWNGSPGMTEPEAAEGPETPLDAGAAYSPVGP